MPTAEQGWYTCQEHVEIPEMYSSPLCFNTSQGSAYIPNLSSTPPQTRPFPYVPFQLQPAELLDSTWDSTYNSSPPQYIYPYKGYDQYPPSLPSAPIDYIHAPQHDTFASSFNNTSEEETRTTWGDVFKEKNQPWDGSISGGRSICARRNMDEYRLGYRTYAQHVDRNLHRRYSNKHH
jgi:hypothetical protein